MANFTYRTAGSSMTGSLAGPPFSVHLHTAGKALKPGTYQISRPRKHPGLGTYALVTPVRAYQYDTSRAYQYESSPAYQYDTPPAYQYDANPPFQYDTSPVHQYDLDAHDGQYVLSGQAIAGMNTLVAGYGAGALMRGLQAAGGALVVVI